MTEKLVTLERKDGVKAYNYSNGYFACKTKDGTITVPVSVASIAIKSGQFREAKPAPPTKKKATRVIKEPRNGR